MEFGKLIGIILIAKMVGIILNGIDAGLLAELSAIEFVLCYGSSYRVRLRVFD